jgi:Ala-tRNA(Pro) deacylase
MTVHSAPRTFLDRLDEARIPYDLIPHRPTATAVEEAAAVGVSTWHVAKTIVLTTSQRYVRAVIPASERLDLRKVRDILGTKHVELVTEATLAAAYPEFELGAVPPVEDLHRDRVLLDVRLLGIDTVLLPAGSHKWSVRISTADLITISDARLADLCKDED